MARSASVTAARWIYRVVIAVAVHRAEVVLPQRGCRSRRQMAVISGAPHNIVKSPASSRH
jgi:hypothetical protein